MNVLTVGCFDMLHEGHTNLLQHMAGAGTPTVLLHDDRSIWMNKGRFPVQPYDVRARNLKATRLVRDVIEMPDCDPARLILRTVGPGDGWLYMRGDDWPDFPGRDVLDRLDVPIRFVPYTPGVSSSDRRP